MEDGGRRYRVAEVTEGVRSALGLGPGTGRPGSELVVFLFSELPSFAPFTPSPSQLFLLKVSVLIVNL